MWMHNVAAAVIMMPMATRILQRFPVGSDQSVAVSKFHRAVVLGVIYSAAIEGMNTLIGTGVNLILVGMWKSYFPEAKPINFSTWFFLGFPLALLIFLALWVILCCLYCLRNSDQTPLQHLCSSLFPSIFLSLPPRESTSEGTPPARMASFSSRHSTPTFYLSAFWNRKIPKLFSKSKKKDQKWRAGLRFALLC
ncbi:hypothetical protein ACFX12_002858 [Malus domestica]